MDAFELLGVEARFHLDLSELGRRQRDLSAALHPDKFVGRAKSERRLALGRAIEVNEAYRQLKDPLTRAQALFVRLKLVLPEGKEPSADPLLLMEMMEAREALRAAGRAGDLAKVESLVQHMGARKQTSYDAVSEGFQKALESSLEAASPQAKFLHQKVGELRYLQRFFDEADTILDEL